MGEPTERDDDTIRVPDENMVWERFYGKNLASQLLPNCPECTARKRKKIQAEYEQNVTEEERSRDDLLKLFDEIEYPMKMDSKTKHFICKTCGLYATREQIGDIRDRLNRRDRTKEDKHDAYLEWWRKSKKDKFES